MKRAKFDVPLSLLCYTQIPEKASENNLGSPIDGFPMVV